MWSESNRIPAEVAVHTTELLFAPSHALHLPNTFVLAAAVVGIVAFFEIEADDVMKENQNRFVANDSKTENGSLALDLVVVVVVERSLRTRRKSFLRV